MCYKNKKKQMVKQIKVKDIKSMRDIVNITGASTIGIDKKDIETFANSQGASFDKDKNNSYTLAETIGKEIGVDSKASADWVNANSATVDSIIKTYFEAFGDSDTTTDSILKYLETAGIDKKSLNKDSTALLEKNLTSRGLSIENDEKTFKTAAYCLKKSARGKDQPTIFITLLLFRLVNVHLIYTFKYRHRLILNFHHNKNPNFLMFYKRVPFYQIFIILLKRSAT